MWSQMNRGNIILWFNEECDSRRYCKIIITGVFYYNTFLNMLSIEKYVLPHTDTPSSGLYVYREWYSEDDEKQCGVVAIRIRVLT